MSRAEVSDHLRRGFINESPRMSSLDEESYLDFLKGLRISVIGKGAVSRAFNQRAAEAIANYADEHGAPITDRQVLREVLESIPLTKFRNRLYRSSQLLKYRKVYEFYDQHRESYQRALDQAVESGPAETELDPDFTLPEYHAGIEFHVKPGNYEGHPLAGLQYHYTMSMWGDNHTPDSYAAQIIDRIEPPEDGKVERILDMAAGIGQMTTEAKRRFPNAEVIGIDVSEPMLKYAAFRANRLNSEVKFSQQRAEQTNFEDNSFDMVFGTILIHEFPGDVADQLIQEAHRVLRPGGRFVVIEHASREPREELNVTDYLFLTDAIFNEEPYILDFLESDLEGRLQDVFSELNPDVEPERDPGRMRLATK